MGLDTAAVMFLCGAKAMGVDFSNTATIGRQWFFPEVGALESVFSMLGVSRDADQFLRENEYSENFFSLLGAQQISSVDMSDFEGATHSHDMNLPLPDDLRGRFSVVHDSGTLEHVFHFCQAIKNCMEMVAVGGHFTQVSNANNYMGHGFWQISPELIYRVFSPANGFHVETVLLHEVAPAQVGTSPRIPSNTTIASSYATPARLISSQQPRRWPKWRSSHRCRSRAITPEPGIPAQVRLVLDRQVLPDYGSESLVPSSVSSKIDSSSRNWDFGRSATAASPRKPYSGANFSNLVIRLDTGSVDFVVPSWFRETVFHPQALGLYRLSISRYNRSAVVVPAVRLDRESTGSMAAL